MDASSALKKAIAEMEAKVTKMKALDAALGDADIKKALENALGVNGASPRKQATFKKNRPTVYDKVVAYFRSRKNEWATLRQIVDDTKMPIGSIRNEFYKAHVDKFEREAHPGGGRETKFRLKESAS